MTFGQPPSYSAPLKYTGDQLADIAGVNFPRAPTVTDVNYPLFCLWRNSNKASVMPDAEGDIWVLIKFVYNAGTQHVDAIWVKIATGSSPPSGGVLTLSDTAGTLVFPTAAGNIQLFGTAGQIDILSDPGTNRLVFSLAGGGTAIDQIQVQAATAPGVNPVNPTAAGLMTVNGNLVVAHGVPIETRSRALNTWNIEPQISSAVAATDVTQNGMSHFNNAHFTIDANGFVGLVGGGQAIDSIGVDATSGTGTNPVLPTAAGLITVNGALVAAGTNPVRSVSTAPNTYQIQVQTSQALAAADSTKVGMSNFSSLDFTVDASGFVQLTGSSSMVGVKNIGFSYNAGTGTFTVHGQDGTALSAANPGFVTLQDPAAFGELLTISVTANQAFIDDNGASEIIGNLFGLSTGVATTGVDIPFFLYAVVNDAMTAIAFMISRFPNSTVAPVAARIGMPSTAVADTQGSFFSIDNVTAADYENNPCLSIGSFRMRMSAADDWTVQTLAARDGIGHFQQGLQFSFPRGQFAAAASKVFKNNGGTAPDDADGGYTYYVDSNNNRIFWQLAFPLIDTAGVGAVNCQLALPFNRVEGATSGSGYFTLAGGYTVLLPYTVPSTNTSEFAFVNDVGTGILTNAAVALNSGIALNGTLAIQFA